MKICLIGTVASSTLNFRKDLIHQLRSQGIVVYVFATDYTPQTRHIAKKFDAIPVDYSLDRSGLNIFSDICNTLRLQKKIKSISPDIVFSFFSKPVIFATLAAKLARVPRVIGMLEGLGYAFTPATGRKEKIKKFLIRFAQVSLYKISFKFVDRLIFLNQNDYEDIIQKHRIHIKNFKILGGIGVDLEEFSYTPPPLHPIRFIFIGRLLTEKGIYEFVAAAKMVKQRFPATRFIALGAPDFNNPASITEEELEILKTQKLIYFTGHVSDVKKWLQRASIFVLPSYREGVPRSTQEAMATGRAIITSDAPGCRDTVEKNKNGFLIPIKNPEKLAEAMIFFIKNIENITIMGSDSRKKAEQYFCSIQQSKKLSTMIIE